ncbi:MAG: hypothetical protein COU27_01510, partial [Candidatus Levybacteria bacterium CG10_big_fil_rev_8_21_14_0_10_36_7]
MTKLLICTQKIDKNDPILGFFHRWVEEFAKHCEQITVICLEKGIHDLPQNVRVFSLGKEDFQLSTFNFQLFQKVKYMLTFWKLIWRERKNYNSVFVHMNQVYIILGGLFWMVTEKKISLWYAHGSISFSLRIATILTHNVFTSTKSGFRIRTKKTKIVGQGIDTDLFSLKNTTNNVKFEIISIGRIS